MQLPSHLLFTGFHDQRLTLGVTGSIAAYKSLDLLRLYLATGIHVSVTLTTAATQFIQPLSFQSLGAAQVSCGLFKTDSSPYAHLQPGREDRAMVIAPVTANTLARIAHGLADDMLSCQALSFPAPLILAPAMNPNLWHAQATKENVALLKRRGHVFVGPVPGDVACGDRGFGRLAPLEHIYVCGLKALTPQDMAGRSILVTLGPTRERYDPVRFWSNPSTGAMGASLAIAAWLRGAEVHAVAGSGSPWLPEDIHRVDVASACEMFEASQDIWPRVDIGCFTAAVADFRPKEQLHGKLKKADVQDGFTLEFTPNPDILRSLSAQRGPGQLCIGFAAETSELHALAKAKLAEKNLDMIVANRIDAPDSGFAVDTNRVCVLDRFGRHEEWPLLPKTEIAWRVWDWLLDAFF
jgi:phosphopantothenoylcysteine decarboxylase / phosphopantothenate---cysteine ligase